MSYSYKQHIWETCSLLAKQLVGMHRVQLEHYHEAYLIIMMRYTSS